MYYLMLFRLRATAICLVLFTSFSFMVYGQSCSQASALLVINSGDWAEEVSWSITDSQGLLVDSSYATYQNNTTYANSICFYFDSCYQINLYDSYGDGWNGASYSLMNEDSTLISFGTLGVDLNYNYNSFCISDINYCDANQVVMSINTGIWAEEISWSITDSFGLTTDSVAVSYQDNNSYQFELCLQDGCYTVNMYDSYGDGWQGGAFEIHAESGELFSEGLLETGSFDQLPLNLNANCDFQICSDVQATNYGMFLEDDQGCLYVSENIDFLSNWTDSTLQLNGFGGRYTELYGYASKDREYAILGSTYGTHIIDVTNPYYPTEITRVEGAYSQSNVTHRDYHTLDNYLYAVCDQGSSSLQIIDLQNLPSSVEVVYDSDNLFSRVHNVFIDTLQSRLYACSVKGYDDNLNYWTSSLCVYDLSNPTQPNLLYDMNALIPSTHDIWVERDTAYINCPGVGTLIWDFSNVPYQINSFTSYPDFGTNHSGWKQDDVYVFAEENNGYDVKVVDVSDLTNLNLLATFNSNVNEFSIAHNLMIKDNLVYLSYYWDGLQVFDISDPENPVKIAYYDTYLPENFGGYNGAWGVYAFLPSGNILISDISNGLFVLDLRIAETQVIELTEGWNLISAYIEQDNFTASSLVASIADSVIIMKNNTGLAYIPEWNYDGIGELNTGEGYQLKINSQTQLYVQGSFVNEQMVDLSQGWNMIGVLSSVPQNIDLVLAESMPDVVIIKDGLGNAYLPEWNFNGIGMMLPGKGYQVKMDLPGQVQFGD